MYEQIILPYSFNALEPHIDSATMEVHFSKHYATYTKNLNTLTQAAGIDTKPIEVLLAHWKTKCASRENGQAIRNNAGGYYNHGLYFGHLSPDGGELGGELADKVSETFGSLEVLKDKLSSAAMGVFGSGWAWLNSDTEGNLSISTSPNQDNPILESEGEIFPILGIDVWEHAYYLKHKNLRADYINDFFHVVNWKAVEENYQNTKGRSPIGKHS